MPKRFSKRLYSTREVCAMLGVNPDRVRYLVEGGYLSPCPSDGKKWYFSDETLGQYLGYPEYRRSGVEIAERIETAVARFEIIMTQLKTERMAQGEP